MFTVQFLKNYHANLENMDYGSSPQGLNFITPVAAQTAHGAKLSRNTQQ